MEAKYWDIGAHVKPQAKRVNPILNEYYNLPWRYVKLLKGDFGFIKDCFHTRAHLRISALSENLASLSLHGGPQNGIIFIRPAFESGISQ